MARPNVNLGRELQNWARYAESDIATVRDAVVIFLCLSFTHLVANLLSLTNEHSILRTCPTASLSAMLTAIGLLASTTVAMVSRFVYDRILWVEAVAGVVSIAAGSTLQLLSKADGFVATANSRDSCSVLVFIPSLLAWWIGESATFLTGAVWLLRWARDPPLDMPPALAVGCLAIAGVGTYFLLSLVVSPWLEGALYVNVTDV
jgi:hypothetical protein